MTSNPRGSHDDVSETKDGEATVARSHSRVMATTCLDEQQQRATRKITNTTPTRRTTTTTPCQRGKAMAEEEECTDQLCEMTVQQATGTDDIHATRSSTAKANIQKQQTDHQGKIVRPQPTHIDGTTITITDPKNTRPSRDDRVHGLIQELSEFKDQYWDSVTINETWRTPKEELWQPKEGHTWAPTGNSKACHGTAVLILRRCSK